MKRLLLIIVVFKIFSFDLHDEENTERKMNEWIKDKKDVSITQSSTNGLAGNFNGSRSSTLGRTTVIIKARTK